MADAPDNVSPRSASSLAFPLFATLLVALATRVVGLPFGLPHTQARPDESDVISVALQFLRGNLSPAFYDYPWFYMFILAAVYVIYYVWGAATGVFGTMADMVASWPLHWEPFFLIARGLSAAAGAATVYVVYQIARRLWDETTGLVSAIFLALAFLHVRDSHYGTTDVMMTLLVMTSIALLLAGHLKPGRRIFVVAGIVGGLATATKYSAVLIAIPILISRLFTLREAGRPATEGGDIRLLWFAAGFVPAFLVGAPFVIFDTANFLAAMQVLQASLDAGTPQLVFENGWLHHVKFSLYYGLGLPLLLAALVGLIVMLISEFRMALLLLAFPLVYFITMGDLRYLFFRYAIPLVPFVCLLAAHAVVLVCRLGIRLLGQGQALENRDPVPLGICVAAACAIIGPSAKSVWDFDRIILEIDNRVVVSEWFRTNVAPGSSFLQSGSRYGHAQIDRTRYTEWVWDGRRRVFLVDGATPQGLPDWILLQNSPLPSTTQPQVKALLQQGYQFVWQFDARLLPDVGRVYDRQDAFFAPFAGFEGVYRPGPNFTVYKRAAGPAAHDAKSVR